MGGLFNVTGGGGGGFLAGRPDPKPGVGDREEDDSGGMFGWFREGRSRGALEWLGDTLGTVGSFGARGFGALNEIFQGNFGAAAKHILGAGRSVLGIAGLGGNPDDWQYTYQDLFEETGLADKDSTFAKWGGLAADILLDPLTYVSAGLTGAGKLAATGTSLALKATKSGVQLTRARRALDGVREGIERAGLFPTGSIAENLAKAESGLFKAHKAKVAADEAVDAWKLTAGVPGAEAGTGTFKAASLAEAIREGQKGMRFGIGVPFSGWARKGGMKWQSAVFQPELQARTVELLGNAGKFAAGFVGDAAKAKLSKAFKLSAVGKMARGYQKIQDAKMDGLADISLGWQQTVKSLAPTLNKTYGDLAEDIAQVAEDGLESVAWLSSKVAAGDEAAVEALSMAVDLRRFGKDVIMKEWGAHLTTDVLRSSSGWKNYVAHIITNEGRRAMETAGETEETVRKAMLKKFSQSKRRHSEMSLTEANHYAKQEWGITQLFETDPGMIRYLRGAKAERAVTGSEFLLHALDQFAKPAAEIAAMGPEATAKMAKGAASPLSDIARALRYDLQSAHQVLAKSGLRIPKKVLEDFTGKWIDNETADELVKAYRAFTEPKKISDLGKLWDSYQTLWKGSILGPFPAFHSVNAMWNVAISMIRLGVDSRQMVQLVGKAARHQHAEHLRLVELGGRTPRGWAAAAAGGLAGGLAGGIPGAAAGTLGGAWLGGVFRRVGRAGRAKTPESAADLAEPIQSPLYGEINNEKLIEIASEHSWISRGIQRMEDPARAAEDVPEALRSSQVGRVRRSLGLKDPRPKGAGIGAEIKERLVTLDIPGRKVWDSLFGSGNPLYDLGSAIENNARLAVGIHALENGRTIDEATHLIDELLLDYGARTDFERGVVGRAIPFWKWTKDSSPVMVKALATRPGLMGMMGKFRNRLATPEAEDVPDWMRDYMPIPIGEKDEDGTQNYVWKLRGLDPHEEIAERLDLLADPVKALLGMTPFEWKILGLASPIIQLPAERILGVAAGTGRDIQTMTRAPELGGFEKFLPGYEAPKKEGMKPRADWEALHFLSKIPANRWMWSISQRMDTRKTPIQKLASLLIGVKVHSVEDTKQKKQLGDRVIQRMIEEGFEGSPAFNELLEGLR